MKNILIKSGAFTIVLAFLVLGFYSCGNKKNDDELQKEITEKLSTPNQTKDQNYKNVTAAVNDGVITLSGQCEGENCVENVAGEVKQISGVKSVENKVQQGSQETDLTLRTSVQSIISKYAGVQADVAAGEVILRGTILRDQVQPLMNELSTLQAKKIDNQLAIK